MANMKTIVLWQVQYDRTDKPLSKGSDGWSGGYFRSKARAEARAREIENDPKKHATNVWVVRTAADSGLF